MKIAAFVRMDFMIMEFMRIVVQMILIVLEKIMNVF